MDFSITAAIWHFDPSLNKDDGWGNIAYDRISEEAIRGNETSAGRSCATLITKYDVISVRGTPVSAHQDRRKNDGCVP